MGFQLVKLLDPLQIVNISSGFVPKGAYDNSVDYAVGDSVSYNGSSYVMFNNASAGVIPTNTTYWQVISQKGDTGNDGADGATGATGSAGADGVVQAVIAGTNITVDATDPANPIVSASGGGGSTSWGSITGTLSDQTDLQTQLNNAIVYAIALG
jgi:hypothetical protein